MTALFFPQEPDTGAAHIFQINVPALKSMKFLTGLKARSCTG